MDADTVADLDAILAARNALYAEPTRDGDHLLVVSDAGVAVLDLPTGEEVASVPGAGSPGLAVSPDAGCFSASRGGELEVRRFPDGDVVHAFPLPERASSGEGRNVLGPGGKHVYLRGPPYPPADWARYDAATGEVLQRYPTVENDENVHAFAASSDGTRVAVAGIKSPVNAGFVAVYEAESGDLVEHWVTAYEVEKLALSPDGSAAVFIDAWGGIVGPTWSDRDFEGFPGDACFVRDGDAVLAALEGELQLRDATTGEIEATHELGRSVRRLLPTADGSLVGFYGDDVGIVAPEW